MQRTYSIFFYGQMCYQGAAEPTRDSMISRRTNNFRPQVLVIFLIALALLFTGMRVPDISRPHGPKPTHRVVLENYQKTFSQHLKQCVDIVAVLPSRLILSVSISYRALSQFVPPLYASLLFSPHYGRSPPAALS